MEEERGDMGGEEEREEVVGEEERERWEGRRKGRDERGGGRYRTLYRRYRTCEKHPNIFSLRDMV